MVFDRITGFRLVEPGQQTDVAWLRRDALGDRVHRAPPDDRQRAGAQLCGLVGLDVLDAVDDPAADLQKSRSRSDPAPALQRAGADAPALRDRVLVDMADRISDFDGRLPPGLLGRHGRCGLARDLGAIFHQPLHCRCRDQRWSDLNTGAVDLFRRKQAETGANNTSYCFCFPLRFLSPRCTAHRRKQAETGRNRRKQPPCQNENIMRTIVSTNRVMPWRRRMIEVAYPFYPSGEPRPMKAVVVQRIATELRAKLFRGATKKIEVPELVRRAVHMNINGREVRLIWDIAHAVHSNDGASVLGICEYDPQEPRSVMISINSDLVKEPELFRSTTVHELAHAIFDMPAGFGGKARRIFRTRRDLNRSAVPIEWREWRADEFMGTFLVPRYPLSKAFARCVTGTGLRLRWRSDSKAPVPALLARENAGEEIDGITDLLAEEFGVSPAFMAVRLSKYGHVIAA